MITVRDLGWKYAPLTDGGKPVESLKRVSFDIRSGSFVGIIGPTGAGKSTLCMALAGIIPNLADGTMSGVVEVNGMNTSRHSVSALSERVGYVQQDPEAQLFCSSVEDEIAFPLENRGVAQTSSTSRSTSCSTWSAWPDTASVYRPAYREARCSAWPSPPRSRRNRCAYS